MILAALVLSACTAGTQSDASPQAALSQGERASMATNKPSATAGVGANPTARSAALLAPTGDSPSSATASALLNHLVVNGRDRGKYVRSRDFGPAWLDVDRNGCDTRNDVLRRDLIGVTVKPGTHGCVVLSGTLRDPYSGNDISFRRGTTTSSLVQIDHVVALGDIWATGGQSTPMNQRVAIANDPLNLLAVSGALNQQKSDADAASWLPPNKAFRCAYVARQIVVKAKYRLWVTPAEKSAMARVLTTCTGPKPTSSLIPVHGVSGVPSAGRSSAPTTSDTPSATTPNTAPPIVTPPVVTPPVVTPPTSAPAVTAPPGAAPTTTPPVPGTGTDPRFATCKAAKAAGYGPYTRGVDPEYTWYRDADGDGIVCE
jgi:hypothetical protein